MGMSSQIGEREDNVLCSDVRNMLFGPMEFSRRDLAALNIMRGRDNGLPDYNEVRKCHGLPKITKWEQINPKSYQEEPDIFEKMAEVYQNLVRYTYLLIINKIYFSCMYINMIILFINKRFLLDETARWNTLQNWRLTFEKIKVFIKPFEFSWPTDVRHHSLPVCAQYYH